MTEQESKELVVVRNLTKDQYALLDILKEPEKVVNLNVTEICKLADISRATYYNAFRSEDFLRALEAEYKAFRDANEFAILYRTVEKAKEGKNHHWAKMFYEMQGRLDSANRKPAQIIVNFNVQRPKVDAMAENVIEVHAEVVEEK